MDTARTSVRLLMAELARARRAIAHGDHETAREAITAALAIDPHNVQALEWQADLREGRAPQPLAAPAARAVATPGRPVSGSWSAFEQRVRQRRASRCVESARAALASGDVTSAQEAVDELAVLVPEHPELASLRREFPGQAPESPPERARPPADPARLRAADAGLRRQEISRPGELSTRTPESIAGRPVRPRPRGRSPLVPVSMAAAAVLVLAAFLTFASREPDMQSARVEDAPSVASSPLGKPDAERPDVAPLWDPSLGDPSLADQSLGDPALGELPPGDASAPTTSAAEVSASNRPPDDPSSRPVTTTGEREGVIEGPAAAPQPGAAASGPDAVRTLSPTLAPPPAETPAAPSRRPPVPVSESASAGLADSIGTPAASSMADPPVPEAAAVAPPSPRPAAPPAASPPVGDEAVRQVLQRYVTAYNRLDASAARAVWPGVDKGALERAFSELTAQTLSFDGCKVSVDEDAGAATCTGQLRWVPRVGGQDARRERRTWRFDLTRNGDDWIITRAEARR